jgi:predicted transcriptional regulator of viral defense system
MQRKRRTEAELAARQYGVVARWQLSALGLGPGAIEYRVRQGSLHPIFRGVYAVGHTALPRLGRTHAAVLACGPDAVLSHRSAAELWGLLRSSRYIIDVTVPRRIKGQSGLKVHFATAIERDEHERIPVTSVAQTLYDIARTEPKRQLERAWDNAERHELLDLAALTRFKSCRALQTLVEEARMPEPTRSELEDMLRDICAAAGLPIPVFNTSVAGQDVDAYWPQYEFVVELDGWEHHKTRADRERDLLKEEKIKLARYGFMRFSYRRLRDHPDQVADVLRECLGLATMLPG